MPAHPVPHPCWIFDQADRFAHLAARARELSEALRRERCDQIQDRPAASGLAARIALNESRFHRLSTCARRERQSLRLAPS